MFISKICLFAGSVFSPENQVVYVQTYDEFGIIQGHHFKIMVAMDNLSTICSCCWWSTSYYNLRKGRVCMCVCLFVCPSTPPTVMNRSSWNFAGVLSLPPLKTGNKNFFDRTKKKFRNFWGIASGRGQMGMSAFISLTVLTRSSWNFAGVILSLLLTTANKKIFWKFFFENFFFENFLKIFFEFVGFLWSWPQATIAFRRN